MVDHVEQDSRAEEDEVGETMALDLVVVLDDLLVAVEQTELGRSSYILIVVFLEPEGVQFHTAVFGQDEEPVGLGLPGVMKPADRLDAHVCHFLLH